MNDDRTLHLRLPLPHKDNYLEDDVPRLREGLECLDDYAKSTDLALGALGLELEEKADSAAMASALAKKADSADLAGKVDSAALALALGAKFLHLLGGVAPFRIAVDDGTGRVNMYWNTLGGKGATFIAAGEDALRILLGTGGAPVQAFYASGAGKNAGDTITWQELGFDPAPAIKAAVTAAQNAANAAMSKAQEAATAAGNAAFPLGYISMLPFRHNELPAGWYFCNGTRYNNDSAQAAELNALATNFKADWGITNNGTTTNVPNWFGPDGRGPAMRAVNGTSRQVGTLEDDAMQNLTGDVYPSTWVGPPGANIKVATLSSSGLFTNAGTDFGLAPAVTGDGKMPNSPVGIRLDASRTNRTAAESRMLNRGMTPAIFLGV